jgi:hypothetical protein
MPLESASFVNQLDQTRPTSTDVKSEGDDVMRLIKSTLKNSFPNVGGAMNASQTELNRMVGATEDVQPRLSATLSAPNGETLNRLPAAASRQGGFLTFNASTGQPEVTFSIVPANTCLPLTGGTLTGPLNVNAASTQVVTFNTTAATGGFYPYQRSGTNYGFLGNAADVVSGGTLDQFAIRAQSSLVFASGGATVRAQLDSAGNFGVGRAPGFMIDAQSSGGGVLRIRGGSASNQGAALFVSAPASDTAMVAIGDRATILGGTPGSTGSVYTNTGVPLTFDVGNAERARFDINSNFIQQAPTSPPSLTVNGQLVMNLTSNTNLRISVRGTDGTTRVANITLA